MERRGQASFTLLHYYISSFKNFIIFQQKAILFRVFPPLPLVLSVLRRHSRRHVPAAHSQAPAEAAEETGGDLLLTGEPHRTSRPMHSFFFCLPARDGGGIYSASAVYPDLIGAVSSRRRRLSGLDWDSVFLSPPFIRT